MLETENTIKKELNASCKHCGLETSAGEDFCCPGCLFAHKFINSNGLEGYYKLKDSILDVESRPAASRREEFNYLLDPQVSEDFAKETKDGLKQINFFVEGLHCVACAWLLEKLPSVVEGVRISKVEMALSRIKVVFEPNKTNVEQIAAGINSLGYYPRLIRSSEKSNFRHLAERSLLLKLGVAGISAGNTMMLAISLYQGYFTGIEEKYRFFFHLVSLFLSLPAVLYSAQPFYKATLAGASAGSLHLDLPISLGIILAFLASCFATFAGYPHVYFDSVCILIFLLLIGRYIQQRSVNSIFDSFDKAYSVVEPFAEVVDANGKLAKTYIQSVSPGDYIHVPPDSRIPVDSEVVEGESHLDSSVLSGESRPEKVSPGSLVYAGAKNLTESLKLRAKKSYRDSRLGRLIESLEDIDIETPESRQMDSLGFYFVLSVLLFATYTFVYWSFFGSFLAAFENTLAFIVVTCPCALGLAKPLSLTLGVSEARKSNILLRTPDTLDKLAELSLLYFDKTGTLTESEPKVTAIFGIKPDCIETANSADLKNELGEEVLAALRLAESSSKHPLGRAIEEFLARLFPEIESLRPQIQTNEMPGKGLSILDTQSQAIVKIGSLNWLGQSLAAEVKASILEKTNELSASPVILSQQSRPVFVFFIGGELRAGAKEVVSELQEMGISTGMLSGDVSQVVNQVAGQLALKPETVHAELLPEQKAAEIKKQQKPSKLIGMVGDGVNDSSALKKADIGISISGGVELSFSSSDIYLGGGELKSLLKAIRGARKTRLLIKKALVFSTLYNISFAALAIAGTINPLVAAVIMPVSSISLIFYAKLFAPEFS